MTHQINPANVVPAFTRAVVVVLTVTLAFGCERNEQTPAKPNGDELQTKQSEQHSDSPIVSETSEAEATIEMAISQGPTVLRYAGAGPVSFPKDALFKSLHGARNMDFEWMAKKGVQIVDLRDDQERFSNRVQSIDSIADAPEDWSPTRRIEAVLLNPSLMSENEFDWQRRSSNLIDSTYRLLDSTLLVVQTTRKTALDAVVPSVPIREPYDFDRGFLPVRFSRDVGSVAYPATFDLSINPRIDVDALRQLVHLECEPGIAEVAAAMLDSNEYAILVYARPYIRFQLFESNTIPPVVGSENIESSSLVTEVVVRSSQGFHVELPYLPDLTSLAGEEDSSPTRIETSHGNGTLSYRNGQPTVFVGVEIMAIELVQERFETSLRFVTDTGERISLIRHMQSEGTSAAPEHYFPLNKPLKVTYLK